MSEWTQERLDGLLAEWQKVLRLQDWDFFPVFRRMRDMEGDNQGEFHPVLVKKEALIRLLDPVDYPSDAVYPYDLELTLVHELVHAHFSPFWDTAESKRVEMEQAIESIAKALVSLKRNGGAP